jgi:hypothetical protein
MCDEDLNTPRCAWVTEASLHQFLHNPRAFVMQCPSGITVIGL